MTAITAINAFRKPQRKRIEMSGVAVWLIASVAILVAVTRTEPLPADLLTASDRAVIATRADILFGLSGTTGQRTRSWSNPETGHYGSLVAKDTSGNCRNFALTVTDDGRRYEGRKVFCRSTPEIAMK